MLRLTRVCAALASLLMATSGLAATLNVGHSGSGAPYTTIQSAINAANDDDTVLVAPGAYYENIDFQGKSINLTSSAGAASTVIDALGTGLPAVTFDSGEPPQSVLNGFTIQNGGSNIAGSLGGLYIRRSRPTISNNILTKNQCYGIFADTGAPTIENNEIDNTIDANGNCGSFGGSGIYVTGTLILATTSMQVNINGNTIQNNTQGPEALGGAGIAYWGGPGHIENNILRNNASPSGSGGAMQIQSSGLYLLVSQNVISGNTALCGGGLSVGPLSGYFPVLLFLNNTLVDNTTDVASSSSSCPQSAQVQLTETSPAVQFVNNIISGSTAYAAITCAPDNRNEAYQPIFDHNLLVNDSGNNFFGDDCQDVTGSYGNLTGSPRFVDRAGGDFHLLHGSSGIDQGNTSGLQLVEYFSENLFTKDLDGNPRVLDSTGAGYPIVDMGAYEASGMSESAPTTLILSASRYIGDANTDITLVAALASSLGQPTGNITFYLDGQPIGTVEIAGDQAILYGYHYPIGVHTLYASYSGQGAFSQALSVTILLNLQKYATTLSVQRVYNPSELGVPVDLIVTAASGDPTYIPSPVRLAWGSPFVPDVPIATVYPDATGKATFTTADLPEGVYFIYARSTGDATHEDGFITSGMQVFSMPDLTITVGANPDPVNVGKPIALSVTIIYTQPPPPMGIAVLPVAPIGTVTFSYNGVTIGSPQTLDANGFATVTTSTLPAGVDNVLVTYAGPAGTGATDNIRVQVNDHFSDIVTIASNANPSSPGEGVIFTANVRQAVTSDDTPTGIVQFSDGPNVVSTVPLTNGTAQWTASTLATGDHTITANYVPSGHFYPNSAFMTQTVLAADDFTLTADTPDITIQTTHHKSMTLHLTASPLFHGNVTISCDGVVPKWATCTVSPSSLDLSSSDPQDTTLTIDTDAIHNFASNSHPGKALWLACLLPLLLFGTGKRRSLARSALILLCSVALCSTVACNGLNPGHVAPGNYTITLKAQGQSMYNAAPTTHTLNLTLSVTP